MRTLIDPFSDVALTAVKPLHRWFLGSFMVMVILFGWKFPLLGFVVPVAMATGMAGGFFRGRYVCGNICPRGSFYDTLFSFFAGKRPLPAFMYRSDFRWGVMVVLMSFMSWRLAQNPTDWRHWGTVFWSMCLITTAVGVPLGMIYRARTWCSFCPVGTFAAAVGGAKYQLEIASDCRQCGICEKQCPMGLTIAEHRDTGHLPHADCIKCSSCMAACPRGALAWPAG